MNYDQLTGVVRAVTPALAAVLSQYFLNDATWTIIITSLSTAGMSVWSYQNNKASAVIATVANMPEVKKVVTDNVTANTGPLAAEPKVVSS